MWARLAKSFGIVVLRFVGGGLLIKGGKLQLVSGFKLKRGIWGLSKK